MWASRNTPLSQILFVMSFEMQKWRKDFAKQATAFLAAFPNGNPQHYMDVMQYILAHPEEISALASQQETQIFVEQIDQFGLRERMLQTIEEDSIPPNFILNRSKSQ